MLDASAAPVAYTDDVTVAGVRDGANPGDASAGTGGGDRFAPPMERAAPVAAPPGLESSHVQ